LLFKGSNKGKSRFSKKKKEKKKKKKKKEKKNNVMYIHFYKIKKKLIYE